MKKDKRADIEILVDITEKKKAEEALNQERLCMAGILSGSNVGTWTWNVQTGATVFNEHWAEIIGYTRAELFPVSIETWTKFAVKRGCSKIPSLIKNDISN